MPKTLSSSVTEFFELLNFRYQEGDTQLSFLDKAEALAQASQLGQMFYDTLCSRYPELADKAVFFSFAKQPNDTWMIFDLGTNAFGIQVDPEVGVIVLFDEGLQQEFGDWHNDLIDAVVSTIEGRYLATDDHA